MNKQRQDVMVHCCDAGDYKSRRVHRDVTSNGMLPDVLACIVRKPVKTVALAEKIYLRRGAEVLVHGAQRLAAPLL